MSSFIDRWFYNRSNTTTSGSYTLNTGTYNTTTKSITGQEKFKNYRTPSTSATTPNLTNVPYAYYQKEKARKDSLKGGLIDNSDMKDVDRSRRSSSSSVSSEESI